MYDFIELLSLWKQSILFFSQVCETNKQLQWNSTRIQWSLLRVMLIGEILVTIHCWHVAAAEANNDNDDDAELTHPQLSLMNGRIYHTSSFKKVIASPKICFYYELLYSLLKRKPDNSSDSPSAKSNRVRWVSAIILIIFDTVSVYLLSCISCFSFLINFLQRNRRMCHIRDQRSILHEF